MTALILHATPFAKMVAPTFRAAYRGFLRAVDAFAEARMRNAVPTWQLRQARRDIERFDRLMHRSAARRVGKKPAAASSRHIEQSVQRR